MMNKNKPLIGGAVLLVVLFSFAIGYAYYLNKPKATLPYFGLDGEMSVQHIIPDFSLTDQRGLNIIRDSVKGKIYVADFFFTTCKSICPIMGTQMKRVYDRYENDAAICFVSHTVDPDIDTQQALAQYASEKKAKAGKWYFLTGDKKQIYDLARSGYFVSGTKGDGGADDFVHTQNFALIDKTMHIRGYYDGTDSTAINKLMDDIQVLEEE